MIVDLVEAGQRGVVEVARERLERLVDPGAAQVERRGDRPRPVEAEGGLVRGGRSGSAAVRAGSARCR